MATRPSKARATARRALIDQSSGRKLAEVVAESIEDDIVAQGWPVGQVIGSELELLERFGVSRSVLREAIRIVENHRVAQMRRGRNGGLIVMLPDLLSIERSVALLLDSENVSGANLADARAVVELAAVETATKSLDEDGISRLKEALEVEAHCMAMEIEAEERFRGAHDLHATIAELSGNPALRLFVDVLVQLTHSDHGRREYRRTVRTAADRRRVEAAVHESHVGIVEAMIAGDAGLAKHRMRRHLDAMKPWLT